MTMRLEHPFYATGIGSLPHQDEDSAFRLIIENFPEIPFWPQLPKHSPREGMVLQYSEGFPSFRWDKKEQRFWIDTSVGFAEDVERFSKAIEEQDLEPFEITEALAKGLRILEILTREEYRNRMKYIKGQVTGPITFGLSLTDQDRRPAFYDPTLRDILVKHLSSKARWMERKFQELFPDKTSIVFFDEPSLSSFGSAFSGLSREDVILSLNECFKAVRGFKGIHCCGNTDWGLLLSTDLDILSFDAYGYLDTLSLYPKELRRFLERGGILAWGIVPTNENVVREDVQSLVERLRKGMEILSAKGIDRELLHQAILTPSCGAASLPVQLAERVCRLTSEVSRRIRETTGILE